MDVDRLRTNSAWIESVFSSWHVSVPDAIVDRQQFIVNNTLVDEILNTIYKYFELELLLYYNKCFTNGLRFIKR